MLMLDVTGKQLFVQFISEKWPSTHRINQLAKIFH